VKSDPKMQRWEAEDKELAIGVTETYRAHPDHDGD
jgi:hypothetical protein